MASPLYTVNWCLFLAGTLVLAYGQRPSAGWQPGTIMAVKAHSKTEHGNATSSAYDITVRVAHTDYVVRYSPSPGSYGFQYSAGLDLLVSVGEKTITFNDMLGHKRTAPIESRKPVTTKRSP
jgi:hypothetical protein